MLCGIRPKILKDLDTLTKKRQEHHQIAGMLPQQLGAPVLEHDQVVHMMNIDLVQ